MRMRARLNRIRKPRNSSFNGRLYASKMSTYITISVTPAGDIFYHIGHQKSPKRLTQAFERHQLSETPQSHLIRRQLPLKRRFRYTPIFI